MPNAHAEPSTWLTNTDQRLCDENKCGPRYWRRIRMLIVIATHAGSPSVPIWPYERPDQGLAVQAVLLIKWLAVWAQGEQCCWVLGLDIQDLQVEVQTSGAVSLTGRIIIATMQYN